MAGVSGTLPSIIWLHRTLVRWRPDRRMVDYFIRSLCSQVNITRIAYMIYYLDPSLIACFSDLFNLPLPALWTVVLGEYNRTEESGFEQRIPVDKIVMHEKYHHFKHDLGRKVSKFFCLFTFYVYAL